jgi:hypothetical protein
VGLKFDLYTVKKSDTGMELVELLVNVDLMFAVVSAGIDQHEFERSMTNTGWVGTCPGYTKYMPIVTVPHGEKLGLDHLDFMMESITGGKR